MGGRDEPHFFGLVAAKLAHVFGAGGAGAGSGWEGEVGVGGCDEPHIFGLAAARLAHVFGAVVGSSRYGRLE